MPKEIYAVLGTSADYSLLAGTGTETTIGVALTPGKGVVKRGTIIQRGEDGLYAPAKTGEMANGECAVLISDNDTGNEASGVAGSAAAYKTGRFIASALILAEEGELTAADLLELRRQGIVTDGDGETINNEVSGD